MFRYFLQQSALYSFLKIFIGEITLKLYFKKIHLHGLENVPYNKPVILASNHPNSFMDALVIKAAVPKPVYSLVRSDVFNTPFKMWLLGKMNMMPIYRIQEGADKLNKNEEVFKKCYRMLGENKIIIIFSEGICVSERRLRKLKKGTSRIVFGAEESTNFEMDLKVVCVGLSYEKPDQFRSEVHIRFAPPINVQEYKALYEKNVAIATNELTKKIESTIAKQMVIIENKETDILVSNIEEIYKKQLLVEFKVSKNSPISDFDVTEGIAKAVNHFYKKDADTLMKLDEDLKGYVKQLAKMGVRDHVVRDKKTSYFVDVILIVLGFPFYLFGLINNYTPYILPYMLAKKTVRKVEFFASINYGAGFFLFLIFYSLQISIVGLIFGKTILLYYTILLPLSAWFAHSLTVFMKKTKGKMALASFTKNKPNEAKALFELRERLIAELEFIKKEYVNLFPCR